MTSNNITEVEEKLPVTLITSNDMAGGSVRPVDSQGLRAMINEHENALQSTLQNLVKQEEFQAEYLALLKTLKHLPEKLSYDAFVPLGPLVMGYGKLIHTNEITCHIGDNWFVECTAKTAEKIAAHRIQKSNEMLSKFQREKELISAWIKEGQRQLVEAEDTGTVEITEVYNEDQEKEWRQKHREHVKKHYQEVAKARQQQSSIPADDDKDVMERLELLELEEELSEYQAKHLTKSRSNSLPSSEKSILKGSLPKTKQEEDDESIKEKSRLSVKSDALQKRRVSFDCSRDTVHSYPAEPRTTAITSPVAEHEPKDEIIIVEAFKHVVIEKTLSNVKKIDPNQSHEDDDDDDNPPERMSLFKQKRLMREGKL